MAETLMLSHILESFSSYATCRMQFPKDSLVDDEPQIRGSLAATLAF